MVTISRCTSKKSLKVFEQIPEKLHRNDPNFVPPFPGSIVKVFSPQSPFTKHGELIPFIAYRNAEPVGRICAVINHAHNAYYKDKTGFFGFFDCIEDEEVAKALFEKAKEEVLAKGCHSLRGPYNPTSNDECGVLTEGFESPPMVMMPYNPPYYLKLYEDLGFKTARNLLAFYMTRDHVAPEKVQKIVKRVKERSGIQVRNINLKKLDEELKIIQLLYNETLNRNWGFVPVQYEDLQYAAGELKAIVDPEMVMIGEKDGEPVGFSMLIPNMNEFMWRAKETQSPLLRALKFIWQLKTNKPKEARLTVLGVRPEYQASGIAAVFYYETIMRGKNKFIGAEMSWVEENNEPMIRSIQLLGGQKYKNYRIYEQTFECGGASL